MLCRLALAVTWIGAAGVAMAQGGARVDCAKADGIERTICISSGLMAADRKMAAAYAALAGKLTGGAKDHLLADQLR